MDDILFFLNRFFVDVIIFYNSNLLEIMDSRFDRRFMFDIVIFLNRLCC